MTQDAPLTSLTLPFWSLLAAAALGLSSSAACAEEISSVYTPLDFAKCKDATPDA
jgi:hypothetical protein